MVPASVRYLRGLRDGRIPCFAWLSLQVPRRGISILRKLEMEAALKYSGSLGISSTRDHYMVVRRRRSSIFSWLEP
jgi:hypothetical protein